jgi:hypothetical protein
MDYQTAMRWLDITGSTEDPIECVKYPECRTPSDLEYYENSTDLMKLRIRYYNHEDRWVTGTVGGMVRSRRKSYPVSRIDAMYANGTWPKEDTD